MREVKIFEKLKEGDIEKIAAMLQSGNNDARTDEQQKQTVEDCKAYAAENQTAEGWDAYAYKKQNRTTEGRKANTAERQNQTAEDRNSCKDERQNQTVEDRNSRTDEQQKQTAEDRNSCTDKQQNQAVEDCDDEQSKNEINEHKLGKFKNPQELLRAYGELEKEFTRRSQRLKELENGKQPVKNEDEWRIAVDKFFKEIPAAKSFAKDIANEIINHPELKEDGNCLNVALVRVLADKFRTPEQLMQDGQFLNDYVLSSERVRDAIIADYLDGVRAGMPPYTMHSGGLQCVAPKVKPATIEEAGFMFLKNNK